jgi:hypothetical protein
MKMLLFFSVDNNLDLELASVVSGVARSRSLISLNISKNLAKIKARDVVHVMEAIVQLIQVQSYVAMSDLGFLHN